MRLWHKDLIEVLPDNILEELWDTCCEIAKRLKRTGYTDDWRSSRVSQYSVEEFWVYARKVCQEMIERGIPCNFGKFSCWFVGAAGFENEIDENDIFKDWHTKRYLWQCYSELEERFDCGQIKWEDWTDILDLMSEVSIIG